MEDREGERGMGGWEEVRDRIGVKERRGEDPSLCQKNRTS